MPEENVNEDKKYPITKTGNEQLNKLMSYYPKQLQDSMQLDADQIKSIKKDIKEIDGLQTNRLPLTCKGHECIFAKKCSLQRHGIAPVGYPCPIESYLMETWRDDYMSSLNVNTMNKIEMDFIKDMVECDIMDMRTSNELAEHGLYDFPILGINEKTGQPYRGKIENIAIGIKLKYKKRKDGKVEEFLATRKAKAKFGISKQIDPSQYAAKLMDKHKKMKGNEIEDANIEIIQDEDVS